MHRAGRRPSWHRLGWRPSTALDALGLPGVVVRALGGNANMHWLVDVDGDRVVLRQYAPWRTLDEVEWELELQRRLVNDGWSVPEPLGGPRIVGDHVAAASSWVPGRRRRPRTDAAVIDDQRARGRLLGELHVAMNQHLDLGQRPSWTHLDRRLEADGGGPTIDDVLDDPALVTPDARDELKAYADRAHEWLDAGGAADQPVGIVHGDLNPTNVLHVPNGAVSVIDFDVARVDLVGAEFAWAPRRHPWAMVDGFVEVVPALVSDRRALAPLSWIAGLDSVRHQARWPSRALPDAFSVERAFLRSTSAHSYG